MIHPPNDGMGTEDHDLPVSTVGAKGREVTIPRNIGAEGFEPRDQTLTRGCAQSCEVIETRLPQPNLIR
jgi:hypothetical protein